MTHMYFTARVEGRISYGHLGRTSLFQSADLHSQAGESAVRTSLNYDSLRQSLQGCWVQPSVSTDLPTALPTCQITCSVYQQRTLDTHPPTLSQCTPSLK